MASGLQPNASSESLRGRSLSEASLIRRHNHIDRFTYEPLETSHATIRLLDLLPPEPGDNGIPHCRIRNWPFPKAIKAGYRALSYTCGSPENQLPIFLNGKLFLVLKNLWHFLHDSGFGAREPSDLFQTLWIDAICINQYDLQERTNQVAMMKDIYANASHVAVWLGQETWGSKVLADIREDLARVLTGQQEVEATSYASKGKVILNATNTDEEVAWHAHGEMELAHMIHAKCENPSTMNAVRHICQNPYWDRMWVVQELALAGNLSVLIGTEQFPWVFWKAVLNVPACQGLRPFFAAVDMSDWAQAVRFSRQIQQRHKNAAVVGPGYLYDQPDKSRFPMRDLLKAFRLKKCADPRDKVFALLGLAQRGDSYPVNYVHHSDIVFYQVLQHFSLIPSTVWRPGMDRDEVAMLNELYSTLKLKPARDYQIEERKHIYTTLSFPAVATLRGQTLESALQKASCVTPLGRENQSITNIRVCVCPACVPHTSELRTAVETWHGRNSIWLLELRTVNGPLLLLARPGWFVAKAVLLQHEPRDQASSDLLVEFHSLRYSSTLGVDPIQWTTNYLSPVAYARTTVDTSVLDLAMFSNNMRSSLQGEGVDWPVPGRIAEAHQTALFQFRSFQDTQAQTAPWTADIVDSSGDLVPGTDYRGGSDRPLVRSLLRELMLILAACAFVLASMAGIMYLESFRYRFRP